jgi:hypothetical protein
MGCCFSSPDQSPANFTLSGPSNFRHAQGWDSTQNKIVTAEGSENLDLADKKNSPT